MRGLAETYMKLAARKKETLKAQGASPDTSHVVRSYYDQAVAIYDEALEFEPDNLEIKEGRAYVLNAATRYDEAIAVYRDIVISKPDDAGVWVNLGYTYSRQGDVDSAVEAYGRAVDLDPDDRDTVLRAARLLYDDGREPASRPWFRRAYLMDTTDTTLGKFLGALYIRDKDYENAVPIYEKLTAENPDDWRLQVNYGVALEKTGIPDEALLVYDEVVRLNPEKVEVYFQAADLLMDQSRFTEALSYAEKGLASHWRRSGSISRRRRTSTARRRASRMRRPRSRWGGLLTIPGSTTTSTSRLRGRTS